MTASRQQRPVAIGSAKLITQPKVIRWEFDVHGLMQRREASINDIMIEKDRRFHCGARASAGRA